ncbi:MAG TPA: hypothetical protein QF873_00500 [Patescibacteria group bacterium]|nr:hypothetical protein [Patescibacteria group bacterium]
MLRTDQVRRPDQDDLEAKRTTWKLRLVLLLCIAVAALTVFITVDTIRMMKKNETSIDRVAVIEFMQKQNLENVQLMGDFGDRTADARCPNGTQQAFVIWATRGEAQMINAVACCSAGPTPAEPDCTAIIRNES